MTPWLPPHDPVDAATLAAAAEGRLLLQGVEAAPATRPDGGIDWRDRGPRDDPEWTYFLNRHVHLLALRAAGRVEEAEAQLLDWITANLRRRWWPHEDLMPAAWKPMACATRLLQVWPQLWWGTDGAGPVPDAARDVMRAAIAEQARHLRRHHRRAHNHTIKELTALAFAALAWPDPRSDAHFAYALAGLAGELERQFTPDGVHVELSCHYHRSALDYYRMVIAFCADRQRALPPGFSDRVEAAHDYLAHAMDPTGHGLLNNNGDRDGLRPVLGEAAAMFGRDDWRHVASLGAEGRPPAHGSDWRPWAGQALLRDGWHGAARFAFFDAGPWGAAHQHDDKLNLTLVGHGRQLLSDGGRYRYVTADPMVRHLRGSAGHNVLMLDGCGQRPGPKRSDGPVAARFVRGEGWELVSASADHGWRGLKGRARHDRALLFVHGWGIVVLDRVVGDRPRLVTAHWRFGPGLDVAGDGPDAASSGAGSGHLRIVPLGSPGWQLDLVRGRAGDAPLGWYSPRYNVVEPVTVARYSATLDSGTLFGWAMPTAATPVARTALSFAPDGPDAARITLADGRSFSLGFA